MNYSINKNNIFGGIVLALALVFVVGLSTPTTAQASTRINSGNKTTVYNITGDTGYSALAYSSGCNTCGSTYYPPVYYPPTPTYIPPIQISCYPQPLTANVGDSATWVSNVYGGTGSYSYSWSGSDGLVGAGPSISKAYYTSGVKSANLTVTSGNQTQSTSCSGSVNVYGSYNNYPPVYVPPPVYTPPPTYYPPQVSCVANTSYTTVGATVTWTATVYGGNNYYNNGYSNYNNGYYDNYNYGNSVTSYTWSGTDGLYGYGQSVAMTYNTPGYKTASVTVRANGQTISQNCSSSVNVTGYQVVNQYSTYPAYPINSNNSGLNIGCYSDPGNASLNQPVTWGVEVTGGIGPYTYSWSGSDGLVGSSDTVIKYYNSYGEKSAVVSVTSADGRTGTRACSNAVNIKRPGGTVTTPVKPVVPPTTTTNDNNGLGASALFSLQNIPWGWVAVLIILVLFATIMYLIFNRPKI